MRKWNVILPLKNLFRRNLQECLVCVLRPAIWFGLGDTYHGIPVCPHFDHVKRPQIRPKTWITGWSILINFLMTADLYFSFKKLQEDYPPGELGQILLDMIKLFNSLVFSTVALKQKSRHLDYLNYLIRLIENRKKYGIETVLNQRTTFIYRSATFCVVAIFAVFSTFFSFTTAWPKYVAVSELIHLSGSVLMLYSFFNIALYLFLSLEIFSKAFSAFQTTILKTLEEKIYESQQGRKLLAEVSLVDQLRYSREFYLRICHIYNTYVLRANFIYYCEQVVEIIAIFVCGLQIYKMYTSQMQLSAKVDLVLQALGVLTALLYTSFKAYAIEESVSMVLYNLFILNQFITNSSLPLSCNYKVG